MKTGTKLAVLFLGLGTTLFALAPPVLKLLTTMGGRLGLQMPGAISFCNVLFVGNFCAGLVMLAFYGPRKIGRELWAVSRKTKVFLLLAALVSTIYPALLFTGLERTTVINVVLLSRFNGIVFVILALLLLKTKIRNAEIAGYAVMSIGVAVLVFVSNGGFAIRSGELFVLLAAVFFAFTELISKSVLRECSIHTYVFFRNAVSSLIFFVIGIWLFGVEHFSDAFTGELWVLMLVYSGIAVVAAQVLWLSATRKLSVQTVANFQLVNPAFSILFAFVLLMEKPGALEWIVMGIILVGMLIPRIAGHATSRTAMPPMSIDTSLVAR